MQEFHSLPFKHQTIHHNNFATTVNDLQKELNKSQLWLQDFQQKTLSQTHHFNQKTILFYRDFQQLTGGHLKHWNYFNHVLSFSQYHPLIYFSPQTIWNLDNPWLKYKFTSLTTSHPISPDILFLEGLEDWYLAKNINHPQIPIINLIQHIRHGDPNNPRYQFLNHKAIRICVSEEVKIVLEKTRQVNGPLFTIPCGIDLNIFSQYIRKVTKNYDICIIATKQPNLGLELREKIQHRYSEKKVCLINKFKPRVDFLTTISQSKIAVFLPNQNEGEGFYLPALEAMALQTIVICPDVIGNRSFCLPNQNCFRPVYNQEEILHSLETALNLSKENLKSMQESARQTVNYYSLLQEKKSFLEILSHLNYLW